MTRRRARQGVRLRVLWTVAVTALALLVPAALYAWGRQSDAFTVRRVVVSGVRLAPPRQVQRLLDEAFVGANLFRVTAVDVRAALRRVPYVADVRTDRAFPHTLRVQVVEWRPVAWGLARGAWYELSVEGHVIRRLPARGDGAGDAPGSAAALLARGPGRGEPRLPGIALPGAPRPGGAVADPGLRAVLRVLGDLPPRLRRQVAACRLDRQGRLVFSVRGGPTVVWGAPGERAAAREAALEAVLGRYRAAGVRCTFLDVTVPDRVVARPVLE